MHLSIKFFLECDLSFDFLGAAFGQLGNMEWQPCRKLSASFEIFTLVCPACFPIFLYIYICLTSQLLANTVFRESGTVL